jgi:hypothetical protein
MGPDFLRLASAEHAEEGEARGRPAQLDTRPSAEYKNPAVVVVEESPETPTPKQQIADVVEKTSGE